MAKQDKKPKLLFGQNMSARVKSPLFWTGVVGILGSAAVSFGDLIGVDLSSQVDTITANSKNIIEFVFLILGLIGVTNNPTTKRYRDAGIEQEYAKPRDDKNPNEFVQWQKNVDKEHSNLREENEQLKKEKEQRDIDELLAPERKAKDVEEFDTSQPFTDDSDEVEFDVADYENEREVALGGSKFHDDSELKDGKEDESEKDDFVENIDDIVVDDSIDDNKEDSDKVIKKKVTKEVVEDKEESDK